MERAVGEYKTVYAEVLVVHFLAVVAAVGVFVLVLFIILAMVYRMVAPFPYTAAHKLVA